MHITDFFIRRPIVAIVFSSLILLIGAMALSQLPIRQFPEMANTTISISTRFPGAAKETVQGFVTTPLSQSIAGASGIDYLLTTTTHGKSEIKARLSLDAKADRSMAEILAKIQEVKHQLPEGATDPVATKLSDNGAAVMYIHFQSDSLSVPLMTDFAARVAQPLFTSIPGVASAEFAGEQAIALRIWLDPVRLAARGLTAEDVAAALRSNNVQSAPGSLRGSLTVTNITAETDVKDIDRFKQLVVKTGNVMSGVVRLADVAMVELGGKDYDSISYVDGKPAVFLVIQPTPDGNPIEIANAARRLIPSVQEMAPVGVTVSVNYDVSRFVNASITEVGKALVEAIVIVIAVIYLFLASFRAVVIPIVTIPLSIIGAAALAFAFGFSINVLTLLAMVLAIGLVVDDAIVILENVHRHIEGGMDAVDAALRGAREVVGPVVSMTITLAAVYAPIGLAGGLTGALFKEFAFTLAGSVMVSGAIALTLSPMMCSALLNSQEAPGRVARMIGQRMEKLKYHYRKLLTSTLGYRPMVAFLSLGVFVSIIAMLLSIQRELAPIEDQGVIIMMAEAPQYANKNYKQRYIQDIEAMFKALPEFESSFMHIGGIAGQSNQVFGGVILNDWAERERGATDIQTWLQVAGRSVEGMEVTMIQPAALPGSGGGLPVQMVIRSPGNFTELYEVADNLKQSAYQSGLFSFVQTNLEFDSSQARVLIDQSRASQMGISMQSIADTLGVLVGDNYLNRFNYHERSYDVIPQLIGNERMSPDDIGQLRVRSSSSRLVPLATFTEIESRPSLNQITQYGQMNAAILEALPKPGVSMGQAVEFLQSESLPTGMTVDWLGDSRQYIYEGNRLGLTFCFALIAIFLVLAAQFESWRDPCVILVTVPLAICGALLPIWLGLATLNIYTQIGLVTLIGLISKHGILMVTLANQIQLTSQLSPREAIVEAATVRLRPILMTTTAMVAGLIPLLSVDGAGSVGRYSMAIVVVVGMLVGTVFTLFILPVVYTMLTGKRSPARLVENTTTVQQKGLAR